MGIFSRNRPPKPHILVHLDEECKGPFRSGYQVAGLITVQTETQQQLSLALASFNGKSTTHTYRTESNGNSSRTIHYHDDAQLFQLDQLLSPTTSLEPNIPYTWRFLFVFPDRTPELLAPSPYTGKKSESKGIYAMSGHELPPSFVHKRSDRRYAEVVYNVQVEVQIEGHKKPFITTLEPFDFIPATPTVEPELLESVLPPEKYSSSRLVGEEKSMMHSIRDKISSSTPSIMLGIKTSLPAHVTPSTAFPIFTCVEIGSYSDPSINIPSIKVWIKSIKLVAITFYRALRVRHSVSSGSEKEEMDEEDLSLNAIPDSPTVDAQLAPGDVKGAFIFPTTFEARIPGGHTPSFKTFNANYAYQIKMTVQAEVSGKVFEHKVKQRVTMLPP